MLIFNKLNKFFNNLFSILQIKSVESAANYPPGIPQTIVGQQKSNCDCESPLCVCDDAEEIVEGHKAHLNMPRALATLPNGNLIIADQARNRRGNFLD
jgi:hypothetical protein